MKKLPLTILIFVFTLLSHNTVADTITDLKERLQKEDKTTVLSEFWKRVAKSGGPLIEAQRHSNQTKITFVWKEDSPNVHDVSLVGGDITPWGFGKPMEKLPGTNVWYKTISAPLRPSLLYGFVSGITIPTDLTSLPPKQQMGHINQFFNSVQPDPFNSRISVADYSNRPEFYHSILKAKVSGFGISGTQFSYLDLTQNLDRSWIVDHDVPHGTVEEFEFPKSIQKNGLPTSRKIGVYLPPGFDRRRSQPYSLAILFDGEDYFREIHTPTILDNLVADAKIAPLVTVFLSIGEGRGPDFYGYDDYVQFLSETLIPFVRERYHVSSNSKDTMIGGFSLGGWGATYAGLKRPDIFGNVMRGDTLINEGRPEASKLKAKNGFPPIEDLQSVLTRYFQKDAHIRSSQKFMISVSNIQDPKPEDKVENWPSQIHHRLENKKLAEQLKSHGAHVIFQKYNLGHDPIHMQLLLRNSLVEFFPR